MVKKRAFIGYFLLLTYLFTLVPKVLPDISTQAYGALLLSYQHPNFLMALFCVLNTFLMYLSLVIPRTELGNIQTYITIRRPKRLHLCILSTPFSKLYFGCYACTKIIAWFVYPTLPIMGIVLLSLFEWLFLYALMLEPIKHRTIPNTFILVPIIGFQLLHSYFLY